MINRGRSMPVMGVDDIGNETVAQSLAEQGAGARKGGEAQQQAVASANKEAAAVLGFSAALAAYGGFFIPKSYGTSIEMTGGVDAALYGFIVFYVSCLLINWWYYARKNAEVPC